MKQSMPAANISCQNNNPRQLLVSVRNAEEAELCMAAGVDWIDLKEPNAGSLGKPRLEVALAVHQVLQAHAKRSVALGELAEILNNAPTSEYIELGKLFPIAKVGLSSMRTVPKWRDELSRLADSIPANLTPVIYADWQLCDAPEPLAIVEWCAHAGCSYLLIDTFLKKGNRLLDYLSIEQLGEIIANANSAATEVVLAGSLSLENVPQLIDLPCAALAVRGAVCNNSRLGKLCAERLRDWVTVMAGTRRPTTSLQSAKNQHSELSGKTV